MAHVSINIFKIAADYSLLLFLKFLTFAMNKT